MLLLLILTINLGSPFSYITSVIYYNQEIFCIWVISSLWLWRQSNACTEMHKDSFVINLSFIPNNQLLLTTDGSEFCIVLFDEQKESPHQFGSKTFSNDKIEIILY